jgi:hypothetical protein
MAAGIRIDIHMTHYAGLLKRNPACLDRLCELLSEAIEEALYAHARKEIREDCSAVLYRSIVADALFDGLGPAWSPEHGSQPGPSSSLKVDGDCGLFSIGAYDDGARHLVVKADWS